MLNWQKALRMGATQKIGRLRKKIGSCDKLQIRHRTRAGHRAKCVRSGGKFLIRTADVTSFIRRYAHVNHAEVCECPRIRCECMRISPRICGSSRECARISVNLFANVRVSPANLRGPSANVRECARMCANVRESANVRECGANVRESARMCANAVVYLRECVANVCECSRECLRMFAYLSRMFAKACRICG